MNVIANRLTQEEDTDEGCFNEIARELGGGMAMSRPYTRVKECCSSFDSKLFILVVKFSDAFYQSFASCSPAGAGGIEEKETSTIADTVARVRCRAPPLHKK
jgi:hypothetical protein